MKKIFLAPKGKRMLSRLVDFVIGLALTAIVYFSVVFPNVFKGDVYYQNNIETFNLYKDSLLYVTNTKGQVSAKSNFSSDITNLEKFYNISLDLDGEVTDNNNLSRDLYSFYTTLNTKYDGSVNYNDETYNSQILKLGSSESNIASFDKVTYKFTLIDSSKETDTLTYLLNAYQSAALQVGNSSKISYYRDANNKMTLDALLMIIPVLSGFILILDGIIPLCTSHGQTIGKLIFKLIVLEEKGYKAKRYKFIMRFIVYYLEIALAIVTFGGGLLIPYTMFLFTKKRQALHDKASGTVVVDGENSIFFDSPEEEAYVKAHIKEEVIDAPINEDRTGSEE